MELQIPPALFYAIGAVLVSFGSLRAYYLGWLRMPGKDLDGEEEAEEDDNNSVPEAESASRPSRRGGMLDAKGDPFAKRHIRFGLLWMIMGVFLIISTVIQSARR